MMVLRRNDHPPQHPVRPRRRHPRAGQAGPAAEADLRADGHAGAAAARAGLCRPRRDRLRPAGVDRERRGDLGARSAPRSIRFDHDAIRKARADRLGRLGLSAAKIKTLKNIAREIAAERLNLEVLAEEDADAAHHTLTALHGIGPWTADVYLLFCLGHGDAWPAGDIAVQEAVKIGLGLKTRPTAKQMAPLAEPWRPLRGAAAHLWWSYYRVLKKREGVLPDKLSPATFTRSSRAQAVTKSITARTAGSSTRSGCASSQMSATLSSFCGATRTRSG